jgi:hypothetical protein
MTSTSVLKIDCSAIADFKAFGLAVSTAFAAAGWVKTEANVIWSGGGVITVVPTVAGTYEVWRMADTLQSSLAFYVRIDYWANPDISLRFTIGNATDGSGGIKAGFFGDSTRAEDAFVSEDFISSDPTSGDRKFQCRFSGSTSSFRMAFFLDSTTTIGSTGASYYAFERSRDNAGDETADFVTFLASGSGIKQQFSIGNRVRGRSLDSWVVPWYPNVTAISHTGVPGVFPVLPVFIGVELPMQNTLICRYRDVPPGGIVTASTAYGDAANYIQIVANVEKDDLGFMDAQSECGILMLWS